MRALAKIIVVLTWALVFIPSAAHAQAALAGSVRDTSGAVLPGVTVEASSPALIEKVRSVVSDGAGHYVIENLRPGIYTVTFTLTGFSPIRREGIELQGSFTATINADLRVGTLEETITVTGESPVVDVRNTMRQRVIDHELIDTLPTGRGDRNLAILIPGVSIAGAATSQDVGGAGNTANASLVAHGGRASDQRITQNGLSLGITVSGGNISTVAPNMAAMHEVTIDTAGVSAELATGGVRINFIPKDGGNELRGTTFFGIATDAMQGNNVTEELRASGLRTPSAIRKLWEFNPGLGGPFVRDKLWFFGAYRYTGNQNYVANIAANLNANDPNAWTFAPDPSSRPYNDIWHHDSQLRLTWQATPKNKLAFSWQEGSSCFCSETIAANISPEAASIRRLPVIRNMTGDWTAPVTNRLLLEAAAVRVYEFIDRSVPAGTPSAMISVTDQALGNLSYRTVAPEGASSALRNNWLKTFYYRGAVSYITGAHTLKVGFNSGFADETSQQFYGTQPVTYRFNNGVPNQITLYAYPYTTLYHVDSDSGIYLQHKWTRNRLTLNYGIRYDHFANHFPEQVAGPAPLFPSRDLRFAKTDGVSWHDLSPRTGASYDVFGTGKTALKFTLNRYLQGIGSGDPIAGIALNPLGRLVRSTTRNWTDANRNYVPDCALTAPQANGECGALANANFGTSVPGATYDPEILTGWGKRPFNWEFSAGVQHEILPRVSVDLSYFRRWYGNFFVTDNLLVGPSDYTAFNLTAPNSDPRLPTAGSQIDGFINLNPNKVGQVSDFVTTADSYGKQTERWNGVDVTLDARPRQGVRLAGGISTGRTLTDSCEVTAEVPEALFGMAYFGNANAGVWTPSQFCRQQTSFLTQYKLLGSYNVPKIDVLVSGVVQSIPGPPILANYVASNAQVAPLLGRNLSANAANTTLLLLSPGTLYGQRMNQIDLRIAKILRFGRSRTSLNLDLFNLMNGNAVLAQNNSFGGATAWQSPQSILTARFFKVSAQVDF